MENTQDLPHLIVDEPKRSKLALFGIIVLSLMLMAIPVGVFLVNQRTQLTPQAAVSSPQPEAAAGIFLESKFSPQSREGIIPVDIYVKSTADPINLANAKIRFDPAFLNVEKIATSSAEPENLAVFNKWLEARSDNDTGKAFVTAGLPNPGLSTAGVPHDKVYLATLLLRPKKIGSTVLQVTSESQLLRNSDNENILSTGSDLVLNLTSITNELPQPLPEVPKKPAPSINGEPLIVITSPALASNYSYFKPVEIVWSTFNVVRIAQINLYINGEIFGPIAQNIDSIAGKYSWKPQDSLSLPYIQFANTFQIEITGVSKTGAFSAVISGPFGIVGVDDVSGTAPSLQAFSANSLSITDASRLLSNYLILPLKEKALDFNKDDVINGLDFYLLRQNLLGRGIVK